MKKLGVVCCECGTSFDSYNINPKYCSKVCKGLSQSNKLDFDKAKSLYESGLSQEEVADFFGVTQKSIYGLFKRNKYKCRIAIKRNQIRENNSYWKANEATYGAFHYRVVAVRGKPTSCEICLSQTESIYEWANLTGKYEDVNDYSRMCRKCHRKYDKNRPNSSKHVSRTKK